MRYVRVVVDLSKDESDDAGMCIVHVYFFSAGIVTLEKS